MTTVLQPDKPMLTADRVRWFADYYRSVPLWGVFGLPLADGNYYCGAESIGRDKWPAELREHAEWFDQLTPSQRRRLGQKAENIANTIVR